ncbi:MAG: hypothetical protein Q8S73_33845 [Deltaproteobacteria bacterium]|nr:hypothetical protein [Deltaproteobacteria bacterium]
MGELRYSPRTVFLPLPLREDLAAALRAAGHRVEHGSVEAFGRCDAVVVVAPWSDSAYFYAGAANGRRKLLLALDETGTPTPAGVVSLPEVARATAATVDELVDLLGRWDPVALTFDPLAAAGGGGVAC